MNPTEEDLTSREYQRRWRARNRDKCNEANREYYERNLVPGAKRHRRLKVGDRFGRLTALRLSKIGTRGNWIFLCDCGKEHMARGGHVCAGLIQSCGCYQSDVLSEIKRTHGYTAGGATIEYRTWINIITRCENPKSINYCRYGAAGISVCERWRNSFPKFLEDM